MNNILEILLNIKFQKYASVSHDLKAVLVYQYLNSEIILWSINLSFFYKCLSSIWGSIKTGWKISHETWPSVLFSASIFFITQDNFFCCIIDTTVETFWKQKPHQAVLSLNMINRRFFKREFIKFAKFTIVTNFSLKMGSFWFLYSSH